MCLCFSTRLSSTVMTLVFYKAELGGTKSFYVTLKWKGFLRAMDYIRAICERYSDRYNDWPFFLTSTLGLSHAPWDEHQDKQDLATIALLWCISRPHPRPCVQWWWSRSHRSPLTGCDMDQEAVITVPCLPAVQWCAQTFGVIGWFLFS